MKELNDHTDVPHNDYLWDKSGEPDPEIVALETLLSPLRMGPAAASATPVKRAMRAPRSSRASRGRWEVLALVSAVLLCASAIWWFAASPSGDATTETSESVGATWTVASTRGTPNCGDDVGCGHAKLSVGEWVETDEASELRLLVPEVGYIDVSADSRLQLEETSDGGHRLHLERGQIHAAVDAPPRLLIVGTPAADAVDLGCEYVLEVDDDGHTNLLVQAGEVALETPDGRPVYVTEGSQARSHAVHGPETPYRQDADAAFIEAVQSIDARRGEAPGVHGEAVTEMLRIARTEDLISLWHVIDVVSPQDRARIYDFAVQQLGPQAATVERSAVLAGNHEILDIWREDIDWAW